MKLPILLSLTVCHFICTSICDNSTSEASPSTELTSPSPPPPPPPKPDVYELHVKTDIAYRYATTVVTSRVVNPAEVAQEVSFTVVLPESAFISGFLMEIKGKVYEAYIKEKEEAKKDYDFAVSQGLGAGYVEQKARDSNQFTVSVNIEPNTKVNFNLTYDQLLSRQLGSYKHVVNINPGQIVRDLSVVVNINESAKITKLEVPDLKLDNDVAADLEKKQNSLAVVTHNDPKSATIRWAPTPEQQTEIAKDGINGQLTVEYDVDRENSQQILVEDGYFVHFFAPETLKPLPKHVVFVLDYSGSMLGKKIEQLKEAMSTILPELSSEDYLSLVIFSDRAHVWSPNTENATTTTTVGPTYYDFNMPVKDQEITKQNIVPATPDLVAKAKEHINTFSDYGGTNIIAGLRNALKLVALGKEVLKNKAQHPEPIIIFLTDGEPNVELSDPEEIIKKVKELNTNNVTLFSLAFGYGADTKFLKKLSLRNDGFHRVIYEAADAAAQLKNFYKEVASPLLSNITFNYVSSQVDQDAATRVDFPNFFNGSEIVVAGKLQSHDQPSGPVESGQLVGKGADGFTSYPIIIDYIPQPPLESVNNHSVSRLEKVWAYLTIQQLLDKADTLTEPAEVNATKSKALNLALKYKFVTPLTSLVVVKPNETTSVSAEQVRPGLGGSQYPSASIAINPNFAMFGNFGGAGATGGFGGSAAGGFMPAPSYPAAMEQPAMEAMPAPPSYPSKPLPIYTSRVPSYPLTMPVTFEETTAPSDETDAPDKGTLDDLPWLYNYTIDNKTFTLPLTIGPADFLLGHNETDAVFGSCTTPSGIAGECRHLEHCVLSVFYIGIDEFLPYRCNIDVSAYLGACCPKAPHHSSTPVLPSSTEVVKP